MKQALCEAGPPLQHSEQQVPGSFTHFTFRLRHLHRLAGRHSCRILDGMKRSLPTQQMVHDHSAGPDCPPLPSLAFPELRTRTCGVFCPPAASRSLQDRCQLKWRWEWSAGRDSLSAYADYVVVCEGNPERSWARIEAYRDPCKRQNKFRRAAERIYFSWFQLTFNVKRGIISLFQGYTSEGKAEAIDILRMQSPSVPMKWMSKLPSHSF